MKQPAKYHHMDESEMQTLAMRQLINDFVKYSSISHILCNQAAKDLFREILSNENEPINKEITHEQLLHLKTMLNKDPGLICTLASYKVHGRSHLMKCRGRHMPELKTYPGFIDDLVSIDHVERYPYDYTTIKTVILRIRYLKETTCIYNTILGNMYEAYFKRMYSIVEKSDIPDSLLAECISIVKPDTKLNICNKLYMCGLWNLLQNISNNETYYNNARENIEQHLEHIKNVNKSALQTFILSTPQTFTSDILNYEDTLFENIDEYPPCDIFRYYENGKIFQFTVPEFQSLIDSGCNFRTRVPIQGHTINYLKTLLDLHPNPKISAPVSQLMKHAKTLELNPVEKLVKAQKLISISVEANDRVIIRINSLINELPIRVTINYKLWLSRDYSSNKAGPVCEIPDSMVQIVRESMEQSFLYSDSVSKEDTNKYLSIMSRLGYIKHRNTNI